MSDLFSGLGRYAPSTPPGHLHLFDVGKYIERAAASLGLACIAEMPVGDRGRSKGRVDIAWLRSGANPYVVAAFEIEGRDGEHRIRVVIDTDLSASEFSRRSLQLA